MNAHALVPRIGFSLATAYLTGQRDHVFERLFGPLDGMLALLREYGASSIEMRAVSPAADAQAVLAAAQRVFDAGLGLTVHGVLPDATMGLDWATHYPALLPLLELMREHGQTLMIPLHAYQANKGDVATLAAGSVQSIRAMAQQADREGWPVRVAVELNRSRGIADPAVDYEGVLGIVRQVDHPRVGICWDWGHGYTNHVNGLLDVQPPEAFIERVCHTHIHGLKEGKSGRTHWPLDEGAAPYQDWVQSLGKMGYDGVWNLELSPDRFEAEPDAAERAFRSIPILRSAILASQTRGDAVAQE